MTYAAPEQGVCPFWGHRTLLPLLPFLPFLPRRTSVMGKDGKEGKEGKERKEDKEGEELTRFLWLGLSDGFYESPTEHVSRR